MTLALVLDTSVLGHAMNPQDKYFECASDLLERLLDLIGDLSFDLKVAIDAGDLLMAEYERTIGTGEASISRALLIQLEMTGGRLERLDVAALHPDSRTLINKQIGSHKPRDRTLAKVGALVSGIVVSDDFEDFTPKVRRALERGLGVRFEDSCGARDLLVNAA